MLFAWTELFSRGHINTITGDWCHTVYAKISEIEWLFIPILSLQINCTLIESQISVIYDFWILEVDLCIINVIFIYRKSITGQCFILWLYLYFYHLFVTGFWHSDKQKHAAGRLHVPDGCRSDSALHRPPQMSKCLQPPRGETGPNSHSVSTGILPLLSHTTESEVSTEYFP